MAFKMIKRILIIISSLKRGGGAERTAAILGTQLYNKGYDIFYLTFSNPSNKYNIKGKYFSFRSNHYSFIVLKRLNKFINSIKKIFQIKIFVESKIIKDFCDKQNIELIISFMEVNNLPTIISRVLFNNKSKLIVSIRTNPDLSYKRSIHILSYFLFKVVTIKYLYKKADLIVPLSRGVGTTLYNYGFSKSSVKPIYNLFDINSCLELSKEKIPFEYRGIFKNSFIFINIGRFVKHKGQIHLIRSFKKVVAKFDSAKLVILGDGILKNELKQLVLNLNLEKNVFFVGVHSNIFPFLKNSNCFVFTSMWEGFGNVIVEALSMNIPVISTDCNYGPREILCPELELSEEVIYPYYGKYGILTNRFKFRRVLQKYYRMSNYARIYDDIKLNDEEDELAEVMIKIIEDSELRNKYSNGLIRAKDFDIKKIIPQWEKIIGII